MPILSVRDIVVDETDANATLTLSLDSPATAPSSVNWSTSNATANSNDYTFFYTQTLDFVVGQDTATIDIPLTNDAILEGTEYFYVNFAAPVNLTLERTFAEIRIVDNDNGNRAPIASVADTVVDESDGTAEMTIILDRSAGLPVTVTYATNSGTANSGSDFTATNGSVTFAAFETEKTISVPILNDSAAEGEEAFTFELTGISGISGAEIGDGVAEIRIGQSDTVPLATPTVSVADVVFAEGAAEAYMEVVLRLDAPAATQTSVNWSTSNGNANSNDYGFFYNNTLVFEQGETIKTVRVPIRDDAIVEGTEHFYVNLNSATGLKIDKTFATLTLTDSDLGDRAPIVSVADVNVDEKAGYVEFAIFLDRAAALPVTVDYQSANDTAVAGSDFSAVTGSVVFNPFETSKTVRIDINDDTTAEGIEAFNFELTGITSIFGGSIGDGSARAIIGKSDGPPTAVPTVSVDNQIYSEGVTEDYLEVVFRLSAPAASETSVNWSTSTNSANTNDFTFFYNNPVVFAAGETVQTVRIANKRDLLPEGYENFYINLNSAVGLNIDKSFATITLVDNDRGERAPIANVDDIWVDETDGIAQFAVTLDRVASEVVTVDYATVSGSAVAGADFDPMSGALKFNPGETVKTVDVILHDDTIGEGIEAFDLELTGISGAADAGVGKGLATATIGTSDGSATAVPQLNVTLLPGLENNEETVTAIFQLSARSASATSVNFSTSNGTANTNDYTFFYNTPLRFAPGETLKVVKFPMRQDALTEGEETFSINLVSSVGINLPASPVTAAIRDDDPSIASVATTAPVVTEGTGTSANNVKILITREGDTSSAQSVDWDVATLPGQSVTSADFVGSGLPGGTVTFGVGEVLKTINVPIARDSAQELDERFAVVLSNATGGLNIDNEATRVTILDDDAGSPPGYNGTAGPDSYTGTSADEEINGNGGADTLNGAGGNDDIDGGTGADSLDGGDGDDSIIGQGGEDTLKGGAGDDTLKGTANNDRLLGEDGNDKLFGELGKDTLDGGLGNDSLVGGNANDSMVGGAGNDTLLGQGQSDIMRGGAGHDSLDGGASADMLYGDSGNDTLKGGAFNDVLYGGGGGDSLEGGSGIDTLMGDGGADTLIGGSSGDHLDGGSANDYLDGGIGKDNLQGGSGSDVLIGGAANDTLDGGAGADNLDGGSSADVLMVFAGEGGDTLTGGAGADRFDFETGFGSARITDFTSADVIDLQDVSGVNAFGDLSISYGANAQINLGGGDSLILEGVTGGLATDDFLF